VTALHFASWLLANTAGLDIPSTATDGQIQVTEAGVFRGIVSCQGRADHSGVLVCASPGPGAAYCALTEASGAYELWVPGGTYDIFVDMALYLNGERLAETVANSASVELPPVTILGGDANEDCIINILDLSLMGGRYGKNCGDAGWDYRADINADCTVNIQDIVLAGSNFLSSCPVPW
jgi:hypothetical protein